MISEGKHPLDPDFRFYRSRSALRAAEYKINPRLNKVTQELHDVYKAARVIEIDTLPKVLQIKVGDREFTSIRRLEGNQIPTDEHPNKDPYFYLIQHEVVAKHVGEGQFGILFLPTLWGAKPNSRELDEYLKDMDGYDDHSGWGTLLPNMLYYSGGRPFKLNEWQLSNPTVSVVKRLGGDLYLGGYGASRIMVQSNDKDYIQKDYIQIARKVKPDEDGRVTLAAESYWWSDQEVEVQKKLNEQLGRFYVMVEGSTDTQERQAKKKVQQPSSELATVSAD